MLLKFFYHSSVKNIINIFFYKITIKHTLYIDLCGLNSNTLFVELHLTYFTLFILIIAY